MMSNDLLKQRILDLAIHGELVDNDLSLQPVDVEAVDGEVPFDIPSNWRWSKVCNIFDVKGGKRIPKGEQFLDEGSHVYIRVADMNNMSISTNNLKYISDDVHSQISRYIITSDDLYITVAGTIGQVGSVPKELSGMNLTENANRLIPLNVDKEFYKYMFNSCFMQDSIKENTTKAAQPKLAIKRINELIIPVPPLKQQSLIANRIDELFALIDQKEKNDQDKDKLKLLLKDKILDSAIHGELVDNDLSLQPVDVEAVDGEVPFDIPSNWKWTTLDSACRKMYAGGDKTSFFSKDKTGELIYPVVANGKDNDGIIGYTNEPTETEECLTISGRGTIGYSVVRNYSFSPVVRLIVLKPVICVNIKYLKFVMDELLEVGRGTSIPQLTIPMIKNKSIPLPPLEQQRKIVEKIEQCFELIEQL